MEATNIVRNATRSIPTLPIMADNNNNKTARFRLHNVLWRTGKVYRQMSDRSKISFAGFKKKNLETFNGRTYHKDMTLFKISLQSVEWGGGMRGLVDKLGVFWNLPFRVRH